MIELKSQIKYFREVVETWLKRKLGKAEGGLILSKAVYLFSIGTNDYMSLFVTNSSFLKSHSKSQYVELVIGNLTTSIKVKLFYHLQFSFKHSTVMSAVDVDSFDIQMIVLFFCWF